MRRLFVYGTLREGAANPATGYGAKYLGPDKIVGAKMFDLGSFPGVRLTGNEDDVVHGDVFEVPSATLARLDAYEGYSPSQPDNSLYVRVEGVNTEDHGDVAVYEYNGSVPDQYFIASGDWFKRKE